MKRDYLQVLKFLANHYLFFFLFLILVAFSDGIFTNIFIRFVNWQHSKIYICVGHRDFTS